MYVHMNINHEQASHVAINRDVHILQRRPTLDMLRWVSIPRMWTREPLPWSAYLSAFLQNLEADANALSNAVGGP
jgi:hypothetical protein